MLYWLKSVVILSPLEAWGCEMLESFKNLNVFQDLYVADQGDSSSSLDERKPKEALFSCWGGLRGWRTCSIACHCWRGWVFMEERPILDLWSVQVRHIHGQELTSSGRVMVSVVKCSHLFLLSLSRQKQGFFSFLLSTKRDHSIERSFKKTCFFVEFLVTLCFVCSNFRS